MEGNPEGEGGNCPGESRGSGIHDCESGDKEKSKKEDGNCIPGDCGG